MKKFKKIILGCLCILFFSLSNVAFASTGTVTGKTVRIRESADSSSSIVTNAYRNDTVNIIGEEGDWYKVQFEGKTGYISKEFVEAKDNNTVENTTTEPENTLPASETSNTTINKNSNLKLLPNFSSRNLGEIQAGTEIEVKSEVTNWLQVTVGSNTGWILKNNVSGYAKNTAEPENTVEPEEVVVNQEPEQTTSESEENVTDSTGDYDKQTGYINTDTVRVRETAGGKIIGNIDINDVVTIIGEEGDWYQITCDEYPNGYVSKSLVTIGKVPSRSLTEERGSEETSAVEAAIEADIQAIEESASQEQNVVQESVAEPAPAPTPEPEVQVAPVSNTSRGVEIAEFAKTFLGCPYVSGGTSPSGFDCSGFTQYVYAQFGYSINRVASAQASNGVEVSRENLQPGDIILFQDYGRTSIGHAAIYIGDGNFVHAANPSRGVVIDNLNTNSYYNVRFVTARRIV